jgi:hypothetical protein
MKKAVLVGTILLSSTACYGPSVLTKKDYIRMSDEEIKKVLLQYTPIGSNEAAVRKIIRHKFRRNLIKTGAFDREQVVNNSNSYRQSGQVRYELGDYFLDTDFASYDWAKHFFLAGYLVGASWLFSKEGILKDIAVSHSFSGV